MFVGANLGYVTTKFTDLSIRPRNILMTLPPLIIGSQFYIVHPLNSVGED